MLSCLDLLAGADNGPPFRMATNWPKHLAIALVFFYFGVHLRIEWLHCLVVLGKVKLSCLDLLERADNRSPLKWPKISQNTKAIYSLGVFRFWSASQNQTKLHCLVVLRKAKPVVILFCLDLLARADNRPPLEWPKISRGDTLLSRSARKSRQ